MRDGLLHNGAAFSYKSKAPTRCLTFVAKGAFDCGSNADRSGFIPIKRDDISAAERLALEPPSGDRGTSVGRQVPAVSAPRQHPENGSNQEMADPVKALDALARAQPVACKRRVSWC